VAIAKSVLELQALVPFFLGGAEDVKILGSDPIIPSRFKVGECSAAALAACAAAAATLHSAHSKQTQSISVDAAGATATLLGFIFQKLETETTPERLDRPTSQIYQTKDGRWYHSHGGFPHLSGGMLELLECKDTVEDIGSAIAKWDAQELEDEVARRGLCGAKIRTSQEWQDHPQGTALKDVPPVEVIKIGHSAPESLPGGDRPLSGARVLDMTRVLAGPTCARTLASHGADVLKINSPNLPSLLPFVIDTGHGKRSAFLDLNQDSDREQLDRLIESADVFSQGYRSGALARKGLGPEDLRRPGIIYVSINCYGHVGPWAERPGWEQLAQAVTGQAITEGGPEGPPRLISAAANDYTTGYLAALGVMEALRRRAEEGGSYHVRASLCQTAMWMTRAGLVGPVAPTLITEEQLNAFMVTTETGFGSLAHLGPIVKMSDTQPRWDQPTVPLGTHKPEWM
jgi:crotonobetainyl-CoA:carnitine CoA-transferase CaiB-like acyl-CoA transferase